MNKFFEFLNQKAPKCFDGFMKFMNFCGRKKYSFTLLIMVLITCVFMYFNPKTNPRGDESRYCNMYINKWDGNNKISITTDEEYIYANEKLKDLYYYTFIHHITKNGGDSLNRLIENNDNYIKLYHEKPFDCIETNTFYAQNNCQEEKDCYMEVTAVLKKKPKDPSIHKKVYFKIVR